MRYRVPANETRDLTLSAPIVLRTGLFVDIVANVAEALVLFEALRD